MKLTLLLLITIALVTVLSPLNAQEVPSPQETEVAPQTSADTDLRQALENQRWTLATATDSEASPIAALFPETAKAYTFTFTDDILNFQGACNSFSGGYQINDQGQLVVGDMRSTMMACAPELMQADTALAALLAQPMNIVLTTEAQPQLQLKTEANETLELQGQLMPEARYGAATLIFLEIDARQLTCRNPRNDETLCLQAREIAFDEQGLRVPPPGPWQAFYDTIEGYTHTPGERNVVRVKRYDRGGVPGSGAPFLYVLDLIVQTESVPQ